MATVTQGTTTRIPFVYRNASDALVDPVTPTVEIRNPSNAVVLSTTPSREDVGEYYYDYAVPADAPVGEWRARFSGIIDGGLYAADVPFTVIEPGFVEGGLISLGDYRIAAGTDSTDTRDDARILQWIPYVSQAIRSFTERDFGAPVVTEDRLFEYDGSGYLDIDDAAAVHTVAFSYSTGEELILDSWDWSPKPERRDDAPVYLWIMLPGYVGFPAGSPEMGFTRNLDLYAADRSFIDVAARIRVNATWGWPVVPGDVKMAAIWTLQEWMSRPSGEALTAEAIEGWSRSWGGRGAAQAAAMAIPARARDILVNYSKLNV